MARPELIAAVNSPGRMAVGVCCVAVRTAGLLRNIARGRGVDLHRRMT